MKENIEEAVQTLKHDLSSYTSTHPNIDDVIDEVADSLMKAMSIQKGHSGP